MCGIFKSKASTTVTVNPNPETPVIGKYLDFGDVIKALKEQPTRRFTRLSWNSRSMWISLQVPDASSKMNLKYIYMRTAQGKLVPWVASQSDMLYDDWIETE